MQTRIHLLGDFLTRDDALRCFLTEHGYEIRELESWSELPASETGARWEPIVLLFDMDVEADIGNRLKEMKRRHPNSFLLAVSAGHYHPDLAQAIEKYLFALLVRPIDWEELLYLLNGIEP